MINTKDITIVFQGAIPNGMIGNTSIICFNISKLRKYFPNAQIILSTWENSVIPNDLVVDKIVQSQDPGALSGIKIFDGRTNNINRQIISTMAGINLVQTKYALKIRTDIYINSSILLETLNELSSHYDLDEKIVVGSYFTLDGRIFERLLFHVSDWIQFGSTSNLKNLWNSKLYTEEEATWYDNHPRQSCCNFYEQFFRTKFAVEQHIFTNYAKKSGYLVPNELVCLDNEIVDSYKRFIKDKLVILDPKQIGYVFNKYPDIESSKFHKINCLTHKDWQWFQNELLLEKIIFLAKKPSYILRIIQKKLYNKLYSTLSFDLYSQSLTKKIKFFMKILFRFLLK